MQAQHKLSPTLFLPSIDTTRPLHVASIAGMTDRETFARNLRAERQRLKLSQEALGYACNLDTSEVSRLERSQRDPRLATIVKLARALDIPPAKLLDGIP